MGRGFGGFLLKSMEKNNFPFCAIAKENAATNPVGINPELIDCSLITPNFLLEDFQIWKGCFQALFLKPLECLNDFETMPVRHLCKVLL